MNLLSPWIHLSLRQLTRKSHAQFLAGRSQLRSVQTAILKNLLGQSMHTSWGREKHMQISWSAEDVATKLPVTTWRDWEPWVEKERQSQIDSMTCDVERFQPTSGSTHKRKWVPYSKKFLAQVDRASAVWMHDLYLRYPRIGQGRHYWSLSWLPDELRSQITNDDLAYFPWLKRQCLAHIMAVPDRVQHAVSAEEARHQTLRHLIRCQELSLFFVWSPTFLIGLCEDLWEDRDYFANDVGGQIGKILRHSPSLEIMVRDLWPNLALLSAWETADAATWANRLRSIFPHVPFQGKGLFATEAVVTIPVEDRTHLAYTSHYYEFQRQDGVVVPSWELRAGDRVAPLVSTGSGLWRYHMGDELEVEELLHGCPILRFLGRQQTVDLVGEKLTFQSAREALDRLGIHALLFLAVQGDASRKPGYELVWEGEPEDGLKQRAEEMLCEHHHYKLARELGQLAPLTVRACRHGSHFFEELSQQMGWVLGDMKWEALVKTPRPFQEVK